MKYTSILFILLFPLFLKAQNTLSVFAGADVYNYQFKNWSDPYFQAGIIHTNIKNDWIREFRAGYHRIEDRNGIIMAIMLGKQFGNKAWRIGSKITGLTDEAPTYLHLMATGSINVTDKLTFSVEYSYLPVIGSNHSLGAVAWYRLWQD